MKPKKHFLPQSLAAKSNELWLVSLQTALRNSESTINLANGTLLINADSFTFEQLAPKDFAQLICYCMSIANRSRALFTYKSPGYNLRGESLEGKVRSSYVVKNSKSLRQIREDREIAARGFFKPIYPALDDSED